MSASDSITRRYGVFGSQNKNKNIQRRQCESICEEGDGRERIGCTTTEHKYASRRRVEWDKIASICSVYVLRIVHTCRNDNSTEQYIVHTTPNIRRTIIWNTRYVQMILSSFNRTIILSHQACLCVALTKYFSYIFLTRRLLLFLSFCFVNNNHRMPAIICATKIPGKSFVIYLIIHFFLAINFRLNCHWFGSFQFSKKLRISSICYTRICATYDVIFMC